MTRSAGRRFATGAGALMGAHAAGKLSSLLFVVVVTRGLGPVAYGWFGFAASFVPLFLIVTTLGLDVSIIRRATDEPARLSTLVASGLLVRAGVGLLAFGAAAATGALLVDGGEARAVLVLVGAALLLDEVTTLLGAAFNLVDRMALFSLALVTNRLVSTALAVVVVARGGGIVPVAVAYAAGSGGALVVGLVLLRRACPGIRLRDADAAVALDLVRHGGALTLAGALNMALFRLDVVLLQALRGAAAVGAYGVAYRFFDSFLFVAYAFGQVLLAHVVRAEGRAADEGRRTFALVVAAAVGFHLPLAVGALFTAPWIVTAVFSSRFAGSADAVRWLTAAAVLYAVAYLARTAAVARGARRSVTVVAAAALVVNVAGNAWAIPAAGITGAAAMTFVGEVVEVVGLLVVLARVWGGVPVERVLAVPVVASAAMAAVLAALAPAAGAGAVAAGAVTYGVLALAGLHLLGYGPSRRRRIRGAAVVAG